MFCDVLHLIYFLKLPCRTCSVIAYSAGALLYQKIFTCGDRETQLWKANATYWSQECSSSDADLHDLKATASNAIKETYVPWDDPVFFEASSAYCPSLRHNLFPGFTHQSQFKFLVKLIGLRAQHAAKAADSQQIFNPDELELVPIYAHRFQRFAWRYFAHTNIASDDFARELFLDTVATCARTSCQAGANDDDDDPAQKPRRTRKRRTEELEARPARRQHAQEEVASAPIDPPSSAETPTPVEEEQDVNMEPAVSSQATPDPTAATTTSDRPAHDTHAAETTSDRSNQHDANSQPEGHSAHAAGQQVKDPPEEPKPPSAPFESLRHILGRCRRLGYWSCLQCCAGCCQRVPRDG